MTIWSVVGRAATAALVLVPVAGCTVTEPVGRPRPDQVSTTAPSPDPSATPGASPSPEVSPTPGTSPPAGPSPTPGDPDGQDVVEDSLAVLDGDREDLARAVAELGGRIVDHVEATDTYVVRFDVDGIEDLIAVRDELRARGLEANLIPFLPTLEG